MLDVLFLFFKRLSRAPLSRILSNVTCQIQEKAPSYVTIFSLPMSLSPMLHVRLKKSPCRTVDFRGQGP